MVFCAIALTMYKKTTNKDRVLSQIDFVIGEIVAFLISQDINTGKYDDLLAKNFK